VGGKKKKTKEGGVASSPRHSSFWFYVVAISCVAILI
jgi:hypothetical protein